MNTDLLGDAIVARLADEVAARIALPSPVYAPGDITVAVFPDVPPRRASVQRFAAVFVACDGSGFGDVESFMPLSQSRTINIAVTLLVRSLRGPKGSSGILDLIREALLGWQPNDGLLFGSPLTIQEERFVGEGEGIWQFVATYQTRTMAVARVPEPTGPRLVEAEFREGT